MGDDHDDDEELLFLDEGDTEDGEDGAASEPWIVLVVDDDEDVHVVSKAVLADVSFRGRPLEILSCHSGREACALFEQRRDVAVMLLDVVMESDDAGLRVVRHVRESVGNRNVRIVLRTGQPGQSPEQEVIVAYDINDYKSKTELTAQKLFTTMITALRSYEDLVTLESSRDGLSHINEASTQLFRVRQRNEFMERALNSLLAFCGGDRGAVFFREPAAAKGKEGLRPLALSGWPAAEEGALLARLRQVGEQGASEFGAKESFVHLLTPDRREVILYLTHPRPIEGMRRELLDLFAAKIAVGFDNVVMHEWLEQSNCWLEEQVRERTRELSEKTARLEVAYRQMDEELKLAHILQQSILPADFPEDDDVEVRASMTPANHVGGDFYHVLPIDEDRLAFLIADVSGKGVPAAFFMLRAYSLLNEIAGRGVSPAECLAEANRRLCEANPLMLFVTLFYGVLDRRSLRLSYATAGHDMPLWLKSGGEVELLPRAGGMLLGTFEEAEFNEGEIQLSSGDRLFLYTDGFTEAMTHGGGWFGLERLQQSVLDAAGRPLKGMMEAIIADVEDFAGGFPQSDDLTCLLLEIGRGH